MTRSFCTVIDDPAAHSALWPYGEVMARARHWCFKQICVLGRRVGEVKAAALAIGRAAQRYGERLVDVSGTALDAPARMRPRIERRRWRGVRRLMREMKVARTARSEGGAAGQDGPQARASAMSGMLSGRPNTSGRRTRNILPQVGPAVGPASETVRPIA
jgi:hypothetical protein